MAGISIDQAKYRDMGHCHRVDTGHVSEWRDKGSIIGGRTIRRPAPALSSDDWGLQPVTVPV